MSHKPGSIRWGLVASFALLLSGCTGEGGVLSQLEMAVQVEPTRLDLGTVWAGTTATRTVRVTNTGAASTDITRASIVGAEGPAFMSVALGDVALPAGTQVSLEVRVTAMAMSTGLFVGSVVVDLRDLDSVEIPLTANIMEPPPCDDFNPCTVDRFDETISACVNDVLPDGAGCEDNNACTVNTICGGGQCLGQPVTCQDDVECTIDACDPDVGCVFEPNPGRCDDDDACTDDLCLPTVGCTNTPSPPGTICHYDGCIEIGFCTAGACSIAPTPDNFPCEDGDGCTDGDTCQAGECTPGIPSEVGALPPINVAEGFYDTALCDDFFDCGGFGQSTVQEVLDVRQDPGGGSLYVLWRGEYLNTITSAPCIPAFQSPLTQDLLPSPPSLPPKAPVPPYVPPDEGEAGGGAADPAEDRDGVPVEEAPQNETCAAAIFYTHLLAGPASLPVTVQLTTTRGPAAGVVHPPLPFGLDEPLFGGHTGRLLVATTDEYGYSIWMRLFDATGAEELSYAVASSRPGVPVGQLRVARWQQDALLVAQPSQRSLSVDCDDFCNDAICCSGLALDAWEFELNTGDSPAHRLIEVAEEDAGLCGQPSGASYPWVLEDFTVSIHPLEGTHEVSFRMNPLRCGDAVAPASSDLRVPFAYFRDPASTEWSGVSRLPINGTLGFLGVESMRHETASRRAAAVYTVDQCDPNGIPDPGPDVGDGDGIFPPCEGGDTECDPIDSCDARWIGWVDLDGQMSLQDQLLGPLTAVHAEAQPLLVELEPKLLARVGQQLELVSREEDGAITRMQLPSLADDFQWINQTPLRGIEGWVGGVANRWVLDDCCTDTVDPCDCDGDALFESEVRRLVLQGFSCGAVTPPEYGCLTSDDCGSGQQCSHSADICLPIQDGCEGGEEGCNGIPCGGRCVDVNLECYPVLDPCVPDEPIPLCPEGAAAAQVDCAWECIDPASCAILGAEDPTVDGGMSFEDGGQTGSADGGLSDAGPGPADGGVTLPDAGGSDGGAPAPAGDGGLSDAG